MKKRLPYIFLTIFCFILCVLIVKFFSGDQFIRGFAGDVIVVVLIYSAAKIIADFNPLKLALAVLAFAWSVEFLQYLSLIEYLGLGHNRLARIVIGSTFDPADLLAYTIGAVFAFLIEGKLIKLIHSVKFDNQEN